MIKIKKPIINKWKKLFPKWNLYREGSKAFYFKCFNGKERQKRNIYKIFKIAKDKNNSRESEK